MVKPEGHANRMYERLRAAYPRVDAEYHAQPAPIRTLEDLPEADLIALLHGIPDVEFWHANLVATQGEQASVLFDAKLASCRANMDAEAKASLGGGAPETQDERLVALTKTEGYLNRAERDAEIFKRPPAPPPRDELQEQIDLIRWVVGDPLDAELEKAREGNPELFDDGVPESFRGLMMEGETGEKFTERMRRRWTALQHLRIDGSKPTNSRALPDMNDDEKAELADLEARNKQTKWLD